jgi:hypothetical protein
MQSSIENLLLRHKIFLSKGCDLSSQSIDDSSHFATFGLSFRPGIEMSMARNDKA